MFIKVMDLTASFQGCGLVFVFQRCRKNAQHAHRHVWSQRCVVHTYCMKHLLSSLCVLTCPARPHIALLLNPLSPYGVRACVFREWGARGAFIQLDSVLKSFSDGQPLKSPLGRLRQILELVSSEKVSVLDFLHLCSNCYNTPRRAPHSRASWC